MASKQTVDRVKNAEGIYRVTFASGATRYRATAPWWTDATGKRHLPTKVFERLEDARDWRRGQLGDRTKGVKRRTGRMAVGEYLDGWIERYEHRSPGNTAARYRAALRHLRALPVWRTKLADLESGDVAAAYDAISPAAVPYVHDALHRALVDAVGVHIGANPAAGAMAGRVLERAERRVWTEQETKRFLAVAASDELAALWRTLVKTGVRRGELLGLEDQDLDPTNMTVTVRRQFAVVGGRHVLKDVKTKRGRRSIDLDAETVRLLLELRKATRVRRLGRDAHAMFVRADGKRVAPTKWLGHRFRELCREAGVREISIHDVRHTHATLLLRAGVPANVVSRRLGHASEAFTLTQYAHVLPDMARQAADVAGRW